MRIAFDGTTLRAGRTGVGYYAEHLLVHLARACSDDEIVVFSNSRVETTGVLPANVRVIERPRPGLRLAWLQLAAPRLLERIRPDVVHFTNGIAAPWLPAPAAVTIHDMSLTLYPRFHPMRRVLLKRPLMGLAAKHAGAVLTISEAARQDIVRLCRVPPERVHVVHGAASSAFRRVDAPAALDEVRRKYSLPSRFMLYVGTIEPRKNLLRLVEAFALARRMGRLPHPLVCVGRYGWKARDLQQHIDALGVTDAVRFIGYVPFLELPVFYSLCEMFVFPSVHEGFGLPVVEAMACGAPVITARTSSLGEIADGVSETVDPLDVDALAAAMLKLARDPELRAEISRRGLLRAKTFSWERAASETRHIYDLISRPVLARVAAARPAIVRDEQVAPPPV